MNINIEQQSNGIELIKIENRESKIVFMNYGARIVSWRIGDNNIVLGNEVEADEFYPHNPFYFGATVGRFGGRIARGQFELNGQSYQLVQNDGDHHLHGGLQGLSDRLFDYEVIENEAEDNVQVHFSTIVKQDEDHYPGNIKVKVVFTYDASKTWTVEYFAESDADTLFNPMNHVYFNLNRDNKVVDNHVIASEKLQMFPLDASGMPVLEPIDLAATMGRHDIDLATLFKTEDARIHQQVTMRGGLDHPFEVKDGEMTISNRDLILHVKTDAPQIVMYTLNDSEAWKSRMNIFKPHSGITVETQSMPNDINLFGASAHSVLKADTPFYSKTSYQVELKSKDV
ncbi:aldose 1-epimerase [Staphylococcus intermedius]|uniref:Aldose 1-epimerase n=1 Tax=Staphylococcus intermedius NCTC 11048 TaxID=1141106 RepID=A0A380G6M7_STAIN|nr:aldose 1-epimerase [Staphylococcus intermedius]PCF63782.1 galactose mutarotase [Staphylococcus intermedius]PCF78497.1 galactose mutarotase [Staphylococcus intermedius]PCF79470.1 galactose mutarotase [Staphylococcus intermedius]PCF86793.1 galactose mutarotase [Staphylococcus intermedius]PCF89873.1 galactose mutarotase [Staphylococcus intermedius]